MKISAALADVTVLAVDTTPFIYFVEQNPTYINRVRPIFRSIASGDLKAFTSVITLTEVLVMPIQTGHTRYAHEYREMLLNSEHITTVSVDSSIAEQAARLRARYSLKTPDALHIATAITSGCQAFLTNDIALKRVQELSVLVLDELELDS